MPSKDNAGASTEPIHEAEENVVGEDEEIALGNYPPTLIPLENRYVSLLSVKSEWVLRIN
jgi:hypothetical protein